LSYHPRPRDERILLRGLTGSQAHGFAGEHSDYDYKGVFAAGTPELCGLRPLDASDQTYVSHEIAQTEIEEKGSSSVVILTKAGMEEETLHEAGKFCRMALTGNPDILELLWLDEQFYTRMSLLGRELVWMRTAFTCADRIRESYLGCVRRQMLRVTGRPSDTTDLRRVKMIRHILRLLYQGNEFYCTGTLRPTLTPTERKGMGELALEFSEEPDNKGLCAYHENYTEKFRYSASPLPAVPDIAMVEYWMRRVRDVYHDPVDYRKAAQ